VCSDSTKAKIPAGLAAGADHTCAERTNRVVSFREPVVSVPLRDEYSFLLHLIFPVVGKHKKQHSLPEINTKMKHLTFSLILVLSTIFNLNLLAQWESIGSGFSSGQRDIFSISVVDENNIWAIAAKTNFTASYQYTKTTDGGMTWEEGSLPDTIGNYYPGNIFALDENTVWIIMINLPAQNHIKIFKTENGGTSWEEQDGEFNEVGHAFAALHFFNENEGVGFGSPGTGSQSIDSLQIFRTIDGGDHWNRIPPNELPAPLSGEGVWVFSGNNSYEVKGDTIWFVTRASRVFRSTDKGMTWNAYDVGISGSGSFPGLSSIAFENSLNGIAVTFQPNRAARTIDGGETWSSISIPSSPRLGAIEYIEGTENTYLTNDGFQESINMLLTTDGGVTWETLPNPPSMDCMQFISPTIGFGGGAINPANDIGLYKWIGNLSDSTTTNTEDVFLNSDKLALSPNPASEILIVELEDNIPTADTINVEIFSMDGRLVLRNRYSSSAGIPIGSLPKGMYNLHLILEDGKRLTKKFIKE
jgi:photosystem II stability/assembly factor-like uncharacterized protein